ncbi:MAG: hypothetical protein RLZZ450_6889 [Pseudomonadota bacterium]|jgi:hypothetical protein
MTDGVAHEVIIPHADPIRPATQVRSTLIQSSLATLKTLGLYDRYLQHLDPAQRDEIVGAIAPQWLPIRVGVAHYSACDALALGGQELLAIGESVGDRMQGAFMETLTRAARNLGVTPWLLLKRFDVLWGRLLQGGSIELVKVGPKDLTIEVRSAKLPQFVYFRTAFCGVVRAGFKYVGVRTAYVRVSSWDERADRFVMRAAWV